MIEIIETAKKKRHEDWHQAEVEEWYKKGGPKYDTDRTKYRLYRDKDDALRTGKARFEVEMPKKLIDEIAKKAVEQGMTRGSWLSYVARLMLREAHFYLTEDQMDSIKSIADREKTTFNTVCQNIIRRGLNDFMHRRTG